jgi:D-xylonolactonase
VVGGVGPEIEIVAHNPDIVGECPTWDAKSGVLLWTDNRSERIYRYDPRNKTVEAVVTGVAAYGFTLQDDESLLLFLANTTVALATNGGVTTLVEGLPGYEDTRFNDVLADPAGRVLCGVLPSDSKTGSLQSIAADGTATVLHEGMQLANGIALSPDDRTLYVADTRARRILAFDYDVASGTVGSPRTFVEFVENEGSPDGITVDEEGCLWVAATGGGRVMRYASDGEPIQRVPLPARKPTSVAFGGDDLDTLFVTSSSREATPYEELGAYAGALFAFRPGVRGRTEHRTAWRM